MTDAATRHRQSRSVQEYLARAGLASSARVDELDGDASDRRYVRLGLPDGSSRMLLVHATPIDPDTLPFVNVAELLRRIAVPVPRILGHEADLGILVLEDLGDTTLQEHLHDASETERRTRYTEAITIVRTLQRQGSAMASGEFVPFGLAFDEAKLSTELAFFVEHFLIGHQNAAIGGRVLDELATELRALAASIAAEPRVLCHRDYHSRNLMLHDDRLVVIDFQDARMGPDTYDLVSLLRDCYVDLDPDLVDELIDDHLATLEPGGRATFAERFDRVSVQRHLKALGTFGYQIAMLGRDRYRDAIPRTLGYLREVLQRRPALGRLRAKLVPHLPELG